jgi:hypothetical protein
MSYCALVLVDQPTEDVAATPAGLLALLVVLEPANPAGLGVAVE